MKANRVGAGWKRQLAVLLVVLLVVTGFTPRWVLPVKVAEAADPVLANGGFEDVTSGLPDHWTVVNGTVASDTSQVHSGTRSLKLTDPSATAQVLVRSDKMPVIPTKEYEATAYSYNTQGESMLYIEFWDANQTLVGINYLANSTLNQWNQLVIKAKAPATAATASVRLYSLATNVGTSYFDDANFNLIPLGISLQNGNMETIENGMPKDWTLLNTTSVVSPATDKVHGGTYSVKLTDNSATASTGLRSNKIAASPGQAYEATVFSYNTQGVSELYVEFMDANDHYVSYLTGLNSTLDQWKQIKVTGTAPAGTVYVTIRYYLHGANVGTAYFDDAAFRMQLGKPVPNLPNGSFDVTASGSPASWTASGGTVTSENATVSGSVYSALIDSPADPNAIKLRSSPVLVDAGASYEATVDAYALSGAGELQVEYWDDGGTLLQVNAEQGTLTNQWEPVTVSSTAPAGAKMITLRLGAGDGLAGKVYFDDATFRRTTALANRKTRSTIYTEAKIDAARDNIGLYDWAAAERDSAVARANKLLSKGLDFLWDSVAGQTLPRSYAVNQTLGSPVTGKAIDAYGNYPYRADPVLEPWKITDPSSGYKFPTNDFGAYYDSGLDEHGVFRPELADRSLLVNTLYPEKGPTWGVDDGFGWVDDNGNRYTFIAYYMHWFDWYDGSSMVQGALATLRNAYLFTGDLDYARAGAIVLDRAADLYPEMDISFHDRTKYLNSHGNRGQGKAIGSIWETYFIKDLISAYDAFYPMMDDPDLVDYLADKSETYGLTNPKSTGGDIRRNIEDGIIRQVYPAVQSAQIYGNDGMHQSALAMAAVVYDTLPETKDWIDFIFQTGGLLTNPYRITGGNILNSEVANVDRDGSGDEAAPGYNTGWLQNHRLTADVLEGYDLYSQADLYDNPKFKTMFDAYYPLLMSENYVANIGDTAYTGNPYTAPLRLNDMLKAYTAFGDPIYAQLAYYLSGNSTDNLHGDIFTANPQQVGEDIAEAIRNYGTLDLPSDNLSGYGFASLRDGKHILLDSVPSYSFPDMNVSASTEAYSLFPASGTLQLDANTSGKSISFTFDVAKTDEYDVNLLPFLAGSYGIYRISIDGTPVEDYDFYGTNNNQFVTLDRMTLTAGTHTISFANLGKNASSSNYKMGLRSLQLMNEASRNARDNLGDRENTLRDFWTYYGRNYGHGHYDTLNLGMHAFGLDLSPDLGYPEFADPLDMHRAQWVINTVSHNTVVVDGRKQAVQWDAEPKHFDDSEQVKLIDVEAPKVYPQTDLYKRTTAMIRVDEHNSYAVDFFRVKGGHDHYFSFHSADAAVATDGLNLVEQPTGTYAGPTVDYGVRVDDMAGSNYQGSGFHYLKNVSRDTSPSGPFSVDWNVKDTWNVFGQGAGAGTDVHLRLTMLGDVDDVALAKGVPPQNKPGNPATLPYLIAHRGGSNLVSLFTSVIEPYKEDRYVDEIETVPVKQAGVLVTDHSVEAVKITLTTGRVDYVINALDPTIAYTVDDKLKFTGFFGVYSEIDGKMTTSYLHDGAMLAPIADTVAPVTGAVTGTIEDFTQTLSGSNDITVSANLGGVNPSDLIGKTIVVENDGVRNATYRILGVTDLGSNLYKLDIGEKTLIRSYVDPSNFGAGFVYDIAEDAAFRIPLTHLDYAVRTTAAVTGDRDGVWYTEAVALSFTVDDKANAAVSTEYSMDGGATWLPYTAPVVVDGNGTHLIAYRSSDAAGYQEEARTLIIRIDHF
ncbi:OmpL47-type beta-barrel domain-containing protein [Cohnella rhizosphaerae]|uniref:Heparinase II/III family protein n=1 Tax=Cohnella rhizosphaerae TaxID=1457232 RepID=A0A9X4L516_9BACL|nr:heparinase II/III family protein [Cohnella rhizosphaerae]MDG0813607.1 heparinase II/III family protein [Cohnella rhizosphaerae]